MASFARGAPMLRLLPARATKRWSITCIGRVAMPVGRAIRSAAVPGFTASSPRTLRTTAYVRNKEEEADSKAKDLSQKAVDKEEEEAIRDAKRKEKERPWHRVGTESSTEPPESSKDPTNGDPTKGRLLTTPTRLLKLVLPLPDRGTKGKGVRKGQKANDDGLQPLALLVHPQQPLSYLERLLQAELPPVKVDGNERIPDVTFRAESEQSREDAKVVDRSGNENVESYSGLGHEGPRRKGEDDSRWVRWSTSTEVGDFIRDAARGREFAIEIEGYDRELRVAVPSFNDRTYYMRVRLRKQSKEIDDMSKLKRECDMLAHRGAYRMAKGGFGVLAGWWGLVYYLSFHTEPGWDLVEPVTYLVGLTTIMGGYLYFLYISRDLNYRAILNVTVSRRQHALYQAKGFDIERWEHLVHDANSLRREIRYVATEYDVDWDEAKDLGSEEVVEVLEKEDKNVEEKKERQKEQEKKREKHKEDGKKKEK